MDENLEQKGLEHLEHIEEELNEIKKRTPGSRRAFTNGILQGMGAIVGGIIAIIALGWVLFVLGLVPGFSVIVHSIQDAMSALHK